MVAGRVSRVKSRGSRVKSRGSKKVCKITLSFSKQLDIGLLQYETLPNFVMI